jgi:hypothetical protein
MFHLGASSSAAGYFLHHPLKFLIKTLLVSVIYMIYMMFLSILNKRTIDVTNIMIILFFWIKLNLKLSNFLTIQKHDGQFSSVGFAGMLKLTPFEGTHYKRWRQKCILWLISMNYFHVVEERAVGPHTSEKEHRSNILTLLVRLLC